jgi:hypothetical protein
MWLYIVASSPLVLLLIYGAMKNGFFTFGIEGLKQTRDHSSKEWKTERAVVPIKSKGVSFNVETDVKWCPKTDEIFYRTPKNTNMFQKDWKEVSQYSDLYDRLLQNFKQKYRQTNQTKNQRTQWTKASKRQTNI